MDARTVGLRLVELTTAGQDATALDELYADSVVSVEVMSGPVAEPQRWEGIRAVRENTNGGKTSPRFTRLMLKAPLPATVTITS